MYMQAGALRHRVSIEKPCGNENHQTAFNQSWELVATLPACIETIRGKEVWEAEQAQSLLTHRITIRHREDIKPNMRVVWGDRIFAVEYVVDLDSARRWMRLNCREVAR